MNCPDTFCNDESIVRIIYSEKNINPRTKTLKLNFVQFRPNPKTNKNELSCIRFEYETIDNCRTLGKHHADTRFNRIYYGLECISVAKRKEDPNYHLRFTPITEEYPQNLFHCDIDDNSIPFIEEEGVALPPEVSYEREIFKNKWLSYEDKGEALKKELIKPH